MTTQRGSGNDPGGQNPMMAGAQMTAQMWETGYRSLFEGWRQAQDFWNNTARSWGEVTGSWMGQMNRTGDRTTNESMAVMRELQEAAFSVAQAWMRLPMVMMGGAQPNELQDAVTRLTQAQGRAYQLWLEAMGRMTGTTLGATQAAADATAQAARTADRETRR